MVTVSEVCANLLADLPDALACGVVDINSGMLVGIHHLVPHFNQAYLDAIAAATVEMFCGRTVKRVEELLSRQRGKPARDSFEEIFISSPTVFHFMKYIREKEVIAILVMRKSAVQGLGWSALRNAVEAIIEALP